MTDEMFHKQDLLNFDYEKLEKIAEILEKSKKDLVIDEQSYVAIKDNVLKNFPCSDNMNGCMYNNEKWWTAGEVDRYIYSDYFYNVTDDGVYVIFYRNASQCPTLDVSVLLLKDKKIINYNCCDYLGGCNDSFYVMKGMRYGCAPPRHLMDAIYPNPFVLDCNLEETRAVTKFIDVIDTFLTKSKQDMNDESEKGTAAFIDYFLGGLNDAKEKMVEVHCS